MADKHFIMPDQRLSSLRAMLREKGFVRIMEAHDGLTGLIVERISETGPDGERSFDGMWVSSLCDSTAKGKPDTELVDFTSRSRTLEDIMEVTTKPVILDGDSGGLAEHLAFNVRSLERIGVSAVIIEDKIGLKKNSLFGTDVSQTQDSIEGFCRKLSMAKAAQGTEDFMIIARIESLILEKGQDDALERAYAYVDAGADGIMIHSRRKSPDEVMEFIARFRERCPQIPIVVVPTSYNSVTEEELRAAGVNVVIYANHFIRSAYPAMVNTARSILAHSRAKEADEAYCMPIKEILSLIPDAPD